MTKECPQCHLQQNDLAKFCAGCGAPLPSTNPLPGKQRFCPSCGSKVSANAKFCGTCQISLTATLTCSRCNKPVKATARFCPHCSQNLSMPLRPATPQPLSPLATGKLPPNAKVANRYSIIKKLGQGGMGAVYLAADNHFTNRQVALKEMSTSGLKTSTEKQEAIDGFKREGQLLCELDHLNIPKVTDVFEENGKQFLVMEYVQGGTMEQLLESRTTPFSEAEVLGWAGQLCNVLDYLHHRNPPVIFRDIKPANVMVLPDMKTIKLIDFGIVRFFKPAAHSDTTKIGTPGYAPPEQYGKGGQSDARSDVYALGAMLHHLLTLRDPASTPWQFSSVRSLNNRVSSRVDQAIAKAVEKDPAQRWQTAKEFAAALLALPASAGASASAGANAALPQTQLMNTPPSPIAKPSVSPQPPQPRQVVVKTPAPLMTVRPAPHDKRIGASLIDGLLSASVSLVAYVMFGANTYSSEWILIPMVFNLLYTTIGHARSGQTIGKKKMHLKVVCRDGSQPGFWRCLWRYFGYVGFTSIFAMIPVIGLLSFLFPFLALFNADHRALHDYLADTQVIEV